VKCHPSVEHAQGIVSGLYCLILGGGGHAKVLVDCLDAIGFNDKCVSFDPDPFIYGKEVNRIGGGYDSSITDLMNVSTRSLIAGLGGSGATRHRATLFRLGLSYGLEPVTMIHPSVRVSPGAPLGLLLAQRLPGSIVNAGTMIGRNVVVNTAAVVEHDSVIGDHAHVATGAVLADSVTVGEGAHAGCGASAKQSITVREGAIIEAGALVIRDVSPDAGVAGVPARPLASDLESI
jgi:sugar O-acyltransferase (sialic acid O-acetyltransferase NeuD family)